MRNLVFISLFIVLTFTFCKKEEPIALGDTCREETVEYISPQTANFKFKKGTYWVYRDSMTLIIDTLRVDSVLINGMRVSSYCDKHKYEFYSFLVNKAYSNQTFSTKDRFSLRNDYFMVNQSTESGNNILYNSDITKYDSLFIYDRYYKSVTVSYLLGARWYVNPTYGLLKINTRELIDKVIIR